MLLQVFWMEKTHLTWNLLLETKGTSLQPHKWNLLLKSLGFLLKWEMTGWMVDSRNLQQPRVYGYTQWGEAAPGRMVRWWCENAYYFERSSSGASVLCGGWMECILAKITGCLLKISTSMAMFCDVFCWWTCWWGRAINTFVPLTTLLGSQKKYPAGDAAFEKENIGFWKVWQVDFPPPPVTNKQATTRWS